MRIRDDYRPFEKAQIIERGGAGHLAVAVQREPASEDRISGIFSPRKNGGDAGAYRANTYLQRAIAGNQRRVANFHALYVGDGVERAGSAVEGNAQVSGARFSLGRGGGEQE